MRRTSCSTRLRRPGSNPTLAVPSPGPVRLPPCLPAFGWILLFVLAFVLALPAFGAAPAPETDGASRRLLARLSEEKARLGALYLEAARLRQGAEDFRDLQLYPLDLARIDAKADMQFDKRIEKLEKEAEALRSEVQAVERGLDDALFICEEMFADRPHGEMIRILEKDHEARVGRILSVKERMDGHWKALEALLEAYRARLGVRGRPPGAEALFQVLRAGTGEGHLRFHGHLHDYKDSLAARADRGRLEKMVRIDFQRLRSRFDKGSPALVLGDLLRLAARLEGRFPAGAVHHLAGLALLVDGRYAEAEGLFEKVPEGSQQSRLARLGLLESAFSLSADSVVLRRFLRWEKEGFGAGESRARYLAAQSAYALGRDSVLERLALGERPSDAFEARTRLLFARSLIRRGKAAEAKEVLRALQAAAGEGEVRHRAALLLGQLFFEEGRFEAAKERFQSLIDRAGFEAEALYGIVWCNLRLKDRAGAEFVLQKLLSQYADHPFAIRGFMLLARKSLREAEEEWGMALAADRARERLPELEGKFRDRLARGDLDSAKAIALRRQLQEAQNKVEAFSGWGPEKVAANYRKALRVCALIGEKYRTAGPEAGAEGETGLLERVRTLRKAPLQSGSDRDGRNETERRRRAFLRRMLFENRLLALDIRLHHKAWLADYGRLAQTRLQARMKEKADSAQDLRRRSEDLADGIAEAVEAAGRAIGREIDTLSRDPLAFAVRDFLLFQKGALLYERAEGDLKRRFALNLWLDGRGRRNGSDREEPLLETAALEAPLELLLEQVPGSAYAPAALYHLGYALQSRGASGEALRHFEALAERYPAHYYTQQALIFIGEHHFAQNNLDKAAEAFDRVLDFPQSRYFDQALYKLAWTRYRASSFKNAISSFTYILEGSLAKEKGTRKAALTSEALQFAALAIAESDTSGDGGIGQTGAFAKKLGDPLLGGRLMHRMAVIYAQQGRLDRARRALDALLTAYPFYEKAPDALMELARTYEKEQDFDKAAEVRAGAFRTYCRGTPWYRAQTRKEALAEADSLLRSAMILVAKHHLFEGQSKGRKAAGAGGAAEAGVTVGAAEPGPLSPEDRKALEYHYRAAIGVYETYLGAYPEAPDRQKLRYRQAEAQFALGDFAPAARGYMEVSRGPDLQLRLLAAYNAIVAAQELVKGKETGGPGAAAPGAEGLSGGTALGSTP